MKRYTKFRAYISGMLSVVLLMGCGTAVFAAGGGNISIGSAGVLINRQSVIEPGEKVTNANGKEIPATLVYTDEAGGGNIYLPIRTISEMLDIPVTWQDGSVYLGFKPSAPGEHSTITFYPNDTASTPFGDITETTRVGATAGPFTEVEPYWPEDENKLTGVRLDSMHQRGTLAVNGSIGVWNQSGNYLSISVTNNTEHPLYLQLYSESTITTEALPRTVIPAGKTVIRTFKMGPWKSALGLPDLGYSVMFDRFRGSSLEEPDITLSARCFTKK